jgi:hypothetical protein
MFRGVALALVLIESVAWADDPLARASQAVAASDYVAARRELAAVRDAGDRSPSDTAEMYRLSGIVEAALGDPASATDAFTHLLALAPKARLPSGTSPRIQQPFDAAARYFATRAPLEVKIETRADPPTITLVVVSDPVGMVARARVVYAIDRSPERTQEAPASRRTEIALPAGRRIDARVTALDAHGNRLSEIGSKEVPIVIIGEPRPDVVTAPAPPVSAPTSRPVPISRPAPTPGPGGSAPASRPIYLRWWPYAAATVVSAGATAYVGSSAYSVGQDYSRRNAVTTTFKDTAEAKALVDRIHQRTLLTDIGVGLTGACAVTAVVMYLIERRVRAEPLVTAVPLAGGAALTVGATF